MALSAPRHVNQLTAGTRFPNGKPSGRYDCSVASGVMALDAYSGGALVPSTTAFRAAQSDQDTNGIGLNDIAEAWRHWGQKFGYGARTWSTIMARLRAGNGVVVQGSYIALGAWRAPGSKFTGGHAMYLERIAPKVGIVVHDPLRSAATVIPESVVARFYLSGLALAGWGEGTYQGSATGVAVGAKTGCPSPDEFRAVLASLGIDGSDDHKLAGGEGARIVAELARRGYTGNLGNGGCGIADGALVLLVLQSLGQPNSFAPGLTNDLNATLAGLPNLFTNGLLHVGLLGGIVLLGLMGVWLTFRESIGMILPGGRRA